MGAINVINNIINNPNLYEYGFKYCLVDKDKVPYNFSFSLCHLNNLNEFIKISDLIMLDLNRVKEFEGIGVSIQASNITAIDVDHCFSKEFDVRSADERAKDILNLFKDYYCEFSFSGKGLRIFFINNKIYNYNSLYHIKNTKNKVEFYYPFNSYKYVTITGNYIYNNSIKLIDSQLLFTFLNKYMKKEKVIENQRENNNYVDYRSMVTLIKKLKRLLIEDNKFQEVRFSKAPGSGKDESERDYYLVATIYEKITKDPNKIKEIFELSDFFKSKDKKHIYKWERGNNEYFYYMFNYVKNTF